MTLRCFSYGGGVQSTAALVLAAQKKIDFPVFLFSNVGDDSEHPDTLRYVEEVAKPYAAAQGIELIEVWRTVVKTGERRTLYGDMMKPDTQRRIEIPVRLANGAPGNRTCTEEYKVVIISRWLKANGAHKTTPASLGMGISIDEYQRMRTDDPRYPHIHKEYPLIDLRLSRADCATIIERGGLPIPPKSSCWFCPFKTLRQWQRLHDDTPELFDRAVILEQTINMRRALKERDAVYLSGALRPLDQAIQGTQLALDFDDACESGFCMV